MKLFWLPQLCRNSAVLLTMAMTELGVTLSLLLNSPDWVWSQFALASLMAQWVTLSCLALLCWLRPRLNRLSLNAGMLATLALCLAVYTLIEVLFQAARWYGYRINWSVQHWLQYGSIALIVCLILLHYFYLLNELRSRSQAELNARLQALHSRIRPHFLFNCLNTIAALIRINPDQAETAVEHLASLFRANLAHSHSIWSLADELALCQGYIQLEQWRMGDRLKMEQQILIEQPQHCAVPRLMLQPLLENAVIHGLQPCAQGGFIYLHIRQRGEWIQCVFMNSITEQIAPAPTNRMALDNCQQRLAALYGQQYRFSAQRRHSRFVVRLWLPRLSLTDNMMRSSTPTGD